MHEVVLIEDGCCHAGELDDLIAFLEARLGPRAKVTKYGIGGHLGFSAVPVELGERLWAQGARTVPVLAVDGQLLFQGALPGPQEVAEAIEAHDAAVAAEAEVTAP